MLGFALTTSRFASRPMMICTSFYGENPVLIVRMNHSRIVSRSRVLVRSSRARIIGRLLPKRLNREESGLFCTDTLLYIRCFEMHQRPKGRDNIHCTCRYTCTDVGGQRTEDTSRRRAERGNVHSCSRLSSPSIDTTLRQV
jgi:hypothetical protein